jgi:hypothetical protein
MYSRSAADFPSSAISSNLGTPLGSKLGAKLVVNEQRMFLLQPMPHTSAYVSIRQHTSAYASRPAADVPSSADAPPV